jgi:hypothetical protein
MCADEVDRRTSVSVIAIHNAQVRAQARPGAIHMADEDGWLSPYEAGHPDCPLSGEFSDVGRTDMNVMGWVMLLMALVGATIVGAVIWGILLYAQMMGW